MCLRTFVSNMKFLKCRASRRFNSGAANGQMLPALEGVNDRRMSDDVDELALRLWTTQLLKNGWLWRQFPSTSVTTEVAAKTTTIYKLLLLLSLSASWNSAGSTYHIPFTLTAMPLSYVHYNFHMHLIFICLGLSQNSIKILSVGGNQ